jgi:uncharacterized protein YifE (UPF0438 family)
MQYEVIMQESFKSAKRFFDNKHYPRGFSRGGTFTIKEANLLESCGEAFRTLENGERSPADDIEARFIQVCRGELVAENPFEKVWLKYRKSTGRKAFYTVVGTEKSAASQITVEEDDDL